MKRVAHVLGASGGGIRRHVSYLAAHPPHGFETAGVTGPPELASYFGVDVDTTPGQADVVHVHGLTALAKIAGKRTRALVVTVHTDIRTQGRTARWPPLRVLARRLATRADAVIAVSDRVRESFPDAVVIPPAFEPLRAPARSREGVRASFETGADRIVVVTAARLHRDKGLDAFVRAVAACGAEGWICGDGPERARIESIARGTDVRVLGHREDIADILGAADVFALPAVGEAYGIAVVEALQAGLPVVGTDAGAIREIVGDAGLIVAVGDEVAFGEAVRDLVASSSKRDELAERARRARLPDPTELVARVGEIYDSVCGG